MLAANKFSALSCSCPGLCSDVAYLLPLCAAVACFFFFFLRALLSLNNAFIQELLITQQTIVSPHWSGHVQHPYAYCIPLFPFFPLNFL